MPIRNYSFSVIRPGDLARPYLPVTIINPDTNKGIKVYALIDTGADECASPHPLLLSWVIIYKMAS
jgi:hypothetical protein